MRKLGWLIAGILCLSVLVHAGEVITNDTGEDAAGVRVAFSSPVLITKFGDSLTSVDPQMLAFEFVFSGGVVEAGESHWMNWAPATAPIVEIEWITGPTQPADRIPSVSSMLSSEFVPDENFMLGGWVCDYLAISKWGNYWRGTSPLALMKQNGFEWVQVQLRMESSSFLRTTPVDRWHLLPWRNEYWSSLEYTGEILRQAKQLGMKTSVILLLSDQVAHAGQQPLAKAWEGLSESEILQEVENYCRSTVQHFESQGIPVDMWHVGNEIEWGMVGYRAGEGIPLPSGVDVTKDLDFMRETVWDVEARILQAAIRGIRTEKPAALISVHVNSLELDPNIAIGFYSFMNERDIDFDYAGLSLPYPGNEWRLVNLSKFTWYEELAYVVDEIAELGWPVVVFEAAYPSRPDGIVGNPMPDYPYTEQGQADWVADVLRFTRNHPNVEGFFYFYPDWFPGMNTDPSTPEDVQAYGLFASDGVPQPAMQEFRVNLNADQSQSHEPVDWALSDTYFTSQAAVAQGVLDRNEIFAMPLTGVPELNFYPVTQPSLLAHLTWTAESSDPEGIGVEITDGMLYIWGASTDWAGRGTVTLTATDAYDNQASVNIPVTAFESDRTLVNEDGVTEYYIPWDPQLDINRILSVEEHMDIYDKAAGALDRTINFSKWRKMEYMNAVNCGTRWNNSSTLTGWTDQAQRISVDSVLSELIDLGVDWIKIDPSFFMEHLTSNKIVSMYGFGGIPTWTDTEIRYVINEAHRTGIDVMGSWQLWPLNHGEFYGPGRGEMTPSSWEMWLAEYKALAIRLSSLYESLGVDVVCAGVELFNLVGKTSWLRGPTYISDEIWNSSMVSVIENVRDVYTGPQTWAPAVLPVNLDDSSAFTRILPVFEAVDIIGFNAYFFPLASGNSPTLSAARTNWQKYQWSYLEPVLERIGKPYIFTEAGAQSQDGVLEQGHRIDPGRNLNLNEQLIYYQSLLEVFSEDPRFFGSYWWDYGFSAPAGFAAGAGGIRDWNSTPRLKPAQDVLAEYYDGRARSDHPVVLDGNPSEWTTDTILAIDELGDSSEFDIDTLYAKIDEYYLYAYISFGESIDVESLRYTLLFMDLDDDGNEDRHLSIGVWGGRHVATLQGSGSDSRPYGFADAIVGEEGIELRLDLDYLGEAWTSISLSFAIHTMSESRVVWLDTLGYPEGSFYGALGSLAAETEDAEEAEVNLTPSSLSSTPQAIAVVANQAFILDWSTGALQKVDIQSGGIEDVTSDFAHVTDIASDGNDLIIVSEDGSAWTFNTETNVSTALDLGASVNGEVLGVAHDAETLYLLVYGPAGPSILSIDDGQSTTTPIQVATAGELISLQMWNGSLLTLDYAAGIAYRLGDSGTSYTLEHAFHITDYVPAEDQASGGVRGFFLTDDVYYFTSMSQDSNPGKLHIVPVVLDPLATSLEEWILTDFGANTGALDTLRYGEDDHGSYLSFTNPSASYNAILQLWSDSSDHNLSASRIFFLDAISIGAPTDMFVEFIHDDASYSEGALFANNEDAPFALTESGGQSISLTDLSVSAGTTFPWDDVDGIMLHFRPSTAEIRFYELQALGFPAIDGPLSTSPQTDTGLAMDIPGLEYLGNPFEERYPNGSGWENARVVWDMQKYRDRIYMAHGDFRGNAGPIDVWGWDPDAKTLDVAFQVDEEEIRRFALVDNTLWIGGTDSTESWDFGTIYSYDGSEWVKLRTLPHAIHVSEPYPFGGYLYVSATVAMDEDADSYPQIFRSSDAGLTWESMLEDESETWIDALFEFEGSLYGSGMLGNQTYRLDGATWSLLDSATIFPGAQTFDLDEMGYTIAHHVTFEDHLVYVAWKRGRIHSDIYAASRAFDSIEILGRDMFEGEPFDLVVNNGLLYVLCNALADDEIASTASLYATRNLGDWDLILEFESPTVVQSFEVLDGYVYFGMGTSYPHTMFSDTGIGAGWALGGDHANAGRVYRYQLP